MVVVRVVVPEVEVVVSGLIIAVPEVEVVIVAKVKVPLVVVV